MQAAVVIGIDQVGGGLARLTAAASGAREVSQWLQRNDYRVETFTDGNGPVERSAIFAAVADLVSANNVERLVVYFAGHGFLKGPLDEFWLLSGAPADAAEAVNVTFSSAMARYKGIPEIIFISDACRVVPKTSVHAGIVGASIFPNTAPRSDSANIDYYYATRPGDPAHERKESEANRAHGLFTQELLNAHKGAPPEALLSIEGSEYVRNRWLKEVLRDRVDLRAQSISLALTQQPDVQIQILDGYLAKNEPEDPMPLHKKSARKVSKTKGPRTNSCDEDISHEEADTSIETSSHSIVDSKALTDVAFQSRLDKVRKAQISIDEAAAEVGTNFLGSPRLACIGGQITKVSSPPEVGVESVSEPFGYSSHLISLDGSIAQIAVSFEDGTGMLLPVLRDYTCEIVRHEGRTVSLAYTWNEYRDSNLANLRAEVLSAATLGLLNRDRDSARAFAARIRQSKRSDPVLGVVSALAYALAGDFDGVRSVRSYMRQDLHADIFDCWLLAGAESDLPIVPSVPMLGQTWSFLDAFDTSFDEDLKRLPRVPGFWSVFEAEAMEQVMQIARRSF